MFKYRFLFAVVFFISINLFSQNCVDSKILNKKLIYNYYNKKGKLKNSFSYNIKSNNMSYTFTITDLSNELSTFDIIMSCSGDEIVFGGDLNLFVMNQNLLNSIEMMVDGNVSYPLKPNIGEELEQLNLLVDFKTEKNIMQGRVTTSTVSRKVTGVSTFVTPHGKVSTYIIEGTSNSKFESNVINMKFSSGFKEYFSPNFAIPIRTESYNKNGKLIGYSILQGSKINEDKDILNRVEPEPELESEAEYINSFSTDSPLFIDNRILRIVVRPALDRIDLVISNSDGIESTIQIKQSDIRGETKSRLQIDGFQESKEDADILVNEYEQKYQEKFVAFYKTQDGIILPTSFDNYTTPRLYSKLPEILDAYSKLGEAGEKAFTELLFWYIGVRFTPIAELPEQPIPGISTAPELALKSGTVKEMFNEAVAILSNSTPAERATLAPKLLSQISNLHSDWQAVTSSTSGGGVLMIGGDGLNFMYVSAEGVGIQGRFLGAEVFKAIESGNTQLLIEFAREGVNGIRQIF